MRVLCSNRQEAAKTHFLQQGHTHSNKTRSSNSATPYGPIGAIWSWLLNFVFVFVFFFFQGDGERDTSKNHSASTHLQFTVLSLYLCSNAGQELSTSIPPSPKQAGIGPMHPCLQWAYIYKADGRESCVKIRTGLPRNRCQLGCGGHYSIYLWVLTGNPRTRLAGEESMSCQLLATRS